MAALNWLIFTEARKYYLQLNATRLGLSAYPLATSAPSTVEPGKIRIVFFGDSRAAEGVIIFDAYSLLADENGLLPKAYAADELHLNAAGYELLNQELVPLLANLQ